MKFTYRFAKILDIREKEKEQQALRYRQAVEKFEQVATRLYELLKSKEELEEEQREKLKTGLTIDQIRKQQIFLELLQKDIDRYQQLVIQARSRMQYEERKLLERNIEVKKFEVLRNKDLEKFLEQLNHEDGVLMDEISMQIAVREKIGAK